MNCNHGGPIRKDKAKLKDWILGTLFGLGIVIAGQDGHWFPWLNVAGVLMIGIAAMASRKLYFEKRRDSQ